MYKTIVSYIRIIIIITCGYRLLSVLVAFVCHRTRSHVANVFYAVATLVKVKIDRLFGGGKIIIIIIIKYQTPLTRQSFRRVFSRTPVQGRRATIRVSTVLFTLRTYMIYYYPASRIIITHVVSFEIRIRRFAKIYITYTHTHTRAHTQICLY